MPEISVPQQLLTCQRNVQQISLQLPVQLCKGQQGRQMPCLLCYTSHRLGSRHTDIHVQRRSLAWSRQADWQVHSGMEKRQPTCRADMRHPCIAVAGSQAGMQPIIHMRHVCRNCTSCTMRSSEKQWVQVASKAPAGARACWMRMLDTRALAPHMQLVPLCSAILVQQLAQTCMDAPVMQLMPVHGICHPRALPRADAAGKVSRDNVTAKAGNCRSPSLCKRDNVVEAQLADLQGTGMRCNRPWCLSQYKPLLTERVA